LRHGEAAQAGDGGGDGDVEGEERFAAFGLAADDADGLLGPQAVDHSQRYCSVRSARRHAGSSGSRLTVAVLAPWFR